MPQCLLHTDTLSSALREQRRVAARLLDHRRSQLGMSSITLAKLRFGAKAKRSRKVHSLITTFAEAITAVPFDHDAPDRFVAVAASLAV